jgi:THO complex subunit 1
LYLLVFLGQRLTHIKVEWAIHTKRAIVSALRDAPDGPAFARVVETVITRDKNWARWKENNCPPISLKPVAGESFAKATKSVKSVCATRPKRSVPLVGMNLEFLSEPDPANGIEETTSLPRYIYIMISAC